MFDRFEAEGEVQVAFVAGSFLSRGLYPVFDDHFAAPGNPSAWRLPHCRETTLQHPDQAAIPLYTLRDIVGTDGRYEPGRMMGLPMFIPYAEIAIHQGLQWPLTDRTDEPLEWVNRGTLRTTAEGRVRAFTGTDSDEAEYIYSEALYALRRKTKGRACDRLWDWSWERGLDRMLRSLLFYILVTAILCGGLIAYWRWGSH